MHLRLSLHRFLFALLLCFTGLTQASLDETLDQFNIEQVLLFLVPHLQSSLKEPGILRYHFERYVVDKKGSKKRQRQGWVTVQIYPRAKQEKMHSVVSFLKGESDGISLDVHNNGQNPLVTTFLQWDVDDMAATLDAHSDYFRHLIRYTLASHSISHEAVQVSYQGEKTKVIKIVFKPFPQKFIQEEFQHLVNKQYEFLIGAKIPGGLYHLMTSIPDHINGTTEYTVLSLSTFIPTAAGR